MRVWIEFLTPKQLRLFYALGKKLEARGHEVLYTTRNFREVVGLLERYDIEPHIIGDYGKTLKEKLLQSLKRMEKLVEIVENFKPDIAISFTSPDMSRVAFGLGIPNIGVSDTPHANHVLRLSLPLTKKLFAPWVIPKKAWLKYGIAKEQIVTYKGIDQVAWIKDFRPNPKELEDLGLEPMKDRYILIRETEVYAAYVRGLTKSLAPASDTLLPHIEELGEHHIVIMPRYTTQIEYLQKKYAENEKVIILTKPKDGTTLIYYSDLLIGGGGTMTGEAALLGVPTISLFPRKDLYVINYLAKKGLVHIPKNKDELIKLTIEITQTKKNRTKYKEKAQKLLESMEDPTEKIIADLNL